MRRSSHWLATATAMAIALTSLAPDLHAQVTATGERIQYAHVIGRDYQFDGPTSLREGIVTFHLTNQGSDIHQLSIIEVGAGHTVKQFYDAMRATGVAPAWAVTVGMTPTVQPNNEAFVTIRLVPGQYIYACTIAAKDARSHVEKGMYQWVNVVARSKVAVPATTKKP
jgi:hypothetical protein